MAASTSLTAKSKTRAAAMAKPAHPERICWGCDALCPADALGCANGSIRTPHPIELFGDDWEEWFNRDERGPDGRTPA
jgi:hypothetical protein